MFRADLLFRLNTIVIRVPPLRQRREDIPLLLAHYLKLYEAQYQRPARKVAGAALDGLCRQDWPGNVRALRHACERAVILGQGVEYGLSDFGIGAFQGGVGQGAAVATAAATKAIAMNSLFAAAPLEGGAVAGSGAGAGTSVGAGTGTDKTLDALERDAIASTLAQFNGNISHAAKTLHSYMLHISRPYRSSSIVRSIPVCPSIPPL